MSRPDYLKQIENRIEKASEKATFISSDFFDIADELTVAKALSRLNESKKIRRIIRGIYDKPRYSDLLKEYTLPNLDTVARAIARNHGWSIVPCGDTALNMLGLSTQVPAVRLYVSDGPYREYEACGQKIRFKHSTQKNISNLSPTSALVVQALKALGQNGIDDIVIMKLKNSLTTENKEQLLAETKQSTAWVYKVVKEVCKEEKDVSYR